MKKSAAIKRLRLEVSMLQSSLGREREILREIYSWSKSLVTTSQSIEREARKVIHLFTAIDQKLGTEHKKIHNSEGQLMADLFSRPCSSCGRPIRFVGTDQGKIMPIDAEPEKRVVIDANDVGRLVEMYTPHWATCPNADQHRSN